MMRPHRLIDGNPVVRAIRRAALLSEADVLMQKVAIEAALSGLLGGGANAAGHWASLADAANMAETLESMGIGSGEEMRNAIADAQESLAWMAQERRERGTWALRHEERQEVEARLQWLRTLHVFQLQVCSYGEFEQAYRRTEDRVRQARAGNAPKGAIVIEGQLG